MSYAPFALGFALVAGCANAASGLQGGPDTRGAETDSAIAGVAADARPPADASPALGSETAAVVDIPPPAVPGPDASAAGRGGSAGCGRDTTEPGVMRKTLLVDGKMRSYVLSVPGTYRPSTPMPLVFTWHGLGGSGMLARSYFGIEQAAAGAAIFVYPDALPLPAFGNSTGWTLGPQGDVVFFDALLAEISASRCVDLGRMFSAGHSFGGYMTSALGCLRGGTFLGIAPVAGGLAGGVCPGRGQATWITHGTNDTVVAFSAGDAARAQWQRAAGCAETTRAVEPSPCVAYDGCRPEAPVHWCPHQLGHAWPPFAGAAIWKFFAALR